MKVHMMSSYVCAPDFPFIFSLHLYIYILILLASSAKPYTNGIFEPFYQVDFRQEVSKSLVNVRQKQPKCDLLSCIFLVYLPLHVSFFLFQVVGNESFDTVGDDDLKQFMSDKEVSKTA